MTIHLYYLIGYRNRLLVLINWARHYLFREHAACRILPCGSAPPRRAMQGQLLWQDCPGTEEARGYALFGRPKVDPAPWVSWRTLELAPSPGGAGVPHIRHGNSSPRRNVPQIAPDGGCMNFRERCSGTRVLGRVCGYALHDSDIDAALVLQARKTVQGPAQIAAAGGRSVVLGRMPTKSWLTFPLRITGTVSGAFLYVTTIVAKPRYPRPPARSISRQISTSLRFNTGSKSVLLG